MNLRKLAFLLALGSMNAWAAEPPAPGALKWDKSDIDLAIAPAQDLVTTEFKCENTSDKTVSILAVRGSCGCIEAAADKKELMPGETAIVKVSVSTKKLLKSEVRRVVVSTDETEKNSVPYPLILRMKLPRTVEISPLVLEWKADEDSRTEKAISVSPVKNSNIKVVAATSVSDAVLCKLVPAEDGSARILVSVKKGAPIKAPLDIAVDQGGLVKHYEGMVKVD